MADAVEFADKPPHLSERRLHSRQPVRSIAYVELDEGNGGIVLNVSEGGLSVQAVVSLMDEQLPRMRIQLPQPKDWVEAGARIAWRGESRKVAGLQFVDLPEQARSQIREWVSRETLPAPLPPESTPQPGKGAPSLVTPAASHAEVQLAAPVGPHPVEEPEEETERQDAAPTAEAVVLPVTQAEELPEALTLRPESAPTPEHTPAPAFKAVARPTLPPAGQVIGGVLDQPRYAELKLTSRPAMAVSHAPRRVARHGVLATLIALLALTSLAAGWAVGRGAFDGVMAKVHAMSSRRNGAGPVLKSPTAGPIAPASEIRAEDAHNLRPAVAVDAPTPAPEQTAQRKAIVAAPPQPLRKPATLQARILSPTIHRTGAEYAGGVEKEVSPPVTEMPGGPGNILSAAEALDLGGPISLRQPERQTGGLKPAELVHRVDPVYPGMARELRIEGTVKLHVTIGADGVVRNVEVLSGPQILVGAAASAVRQWRYSPTLLNGQPIQTENEISLVFRLP